MQCHVSSVGLHRKMHGLFWHLKKSTEAVNRGAGVTPRDASKENAGLDPPLNSTQICNKLQLLNCMIVPSKMQRYKQRLVVCKSKTHKKLPHTTL
jgi:hypothetical protein